jgi:dephospho-CoA kinase
MESAITRLVEQRGMLEADARARLASQPPRDVRLQHAGFVIDNSREREALPPQVDRAWEWLRSLANAKIKRRLPRSDPVD